MTNSPMPPFGRATFGAALLMALLCIAPHAARSETPDASTTPTLVERLRQHALPMSMKEGRLRGPGADWITRESANAQFVLIGEDHGMAQPPQIAAALWNAPAGAAFRQLVVETGPNAAAAMEQALREAPEGLAKLNARYPTAIPYFTWREDGDLAATAIASQPNDTLCGVDQEFILSGRPLFRRLSTMAPDASAAKLARRFATRDDALYAEMVGQRNPDAALLTRLEPREFDALRQAFAGRDDAQALISDIAASAEIYRLQSSDPVRSNTLRSALMKRNFMRCLSRVQADGSTSRVLFRMGAFHVGRGRNPLGLFDLGNLASELAQSRGSTSLHLLVIAAGGRVNRWFPFAPDDAAKHAAYNAAEELGAVGARPLLEAADATASTSWLLFPLRPLRTQPALRRSGGELFDHLVFGYDAVIVVPEAQAATLYDDPVR